MNFYLFIFPIFFSLYFSNFQELGICSLIICLIYISKKKKVQMIQLILVLFHTRVHIHVPYRKFIFVNFAQNTVCRPSSSWLDIGRLEPVKEFGLLGLSPSHFK